jgi:hypothetical protein
MNETEAVDIQSNIGIGKAKLQRADVKSFKSSLLLLLEE